MAEIVIFYADFSGHVDRLNHNQSGYLWDFQSGLGICKLADRYCPTIPARDSSDLPILKVAGQSLKPMADTSSRRFSSP